MRIPNEQGELGKYDDVCERVCAETKAQGVCVIVIRGHKGSGFSMSMVNAPDEARLRALAIALRLAANKIESTFEN